MRIASAVFGVVLIALGAATLCDRSYLPLWLLPDDAFAHTTLVYLCTVVSILAGAGLLWPRTAALAARGFLIYATTWTLVFPFRFALKAPGDLGSWYGVGEPAVLVAAALILDASLAPNRNRARSVPAARVVYGLALIPFGLGHFVYLERTASLVPSWLPAPVALAYITGGAFLVAAAAIVTGIFARLAATLSTVQIALMSLLVWTTLSAHRPLDGFEWNEVGSSLALAIAGWIVSESYRSKA
jgi:uncharacterized membrane protein